MKVKDIIASALRLIGRAELIRDISDPLWSDYEDAEEVIETLLYCFNAVEDELSRKYIPLIASEEMLSPDTKFSYSDFQHCPLKIRSVTVDGKKAVFEIFPKFMQVSAKKIFTEYEYVPKRKKVADDSDYGDDVGEYLIALGMASEYSVINGEAEMADIWEKKYRTRLDEVQRMLPVCACIPPRRWV